MKEAALWVGSGVVITLLFFGLIGWGTGRWNQYECNRYATVTGRPTRFKYVRDCYVLTNKGWFLQEQVRDIAND